MEIVLAAVVAAAVAGIVVIAGQRRRPAALDDREHRFGIGSYRGASIRPVQDDAGLLGREIPIRHVQHLLVRRRENALTRPE